MNDSLQASFWTMVVIQTIGSIDMPGRGPRKMPAPRQYIAILVTWLVLQLISGISAAAQRATAAVGWALVLTGLVVGPFGKQAINAMTTITTNFAPDSSLGQAISAGEARAGINPNNPASTPSTLTPFPPSGVTLKPGG